MRCLSSLDFFWTLLMMGSIISYSIPYKDRAMKQGCLKFLSPECRLESRLHGWHTKCGPWTPSAFSQTWCRVSAPSHRRTNSGCESHPWRSKLRSRLRHALSRTFSGTDLFSPSKPTADFQLRCERPGINSWSSPADVAQLFQGICQNYSVDCFEGAEPKHFQSLLYFVIFPVWELWKHAQSHGGCHLGDVEVTKLRP